VNVGVNRCYQNSEPGHYVINARNVAVARFTSLDSAERRDGLVAVCEKDAWHGARVELTDVQSAVADGREAMFRVP